MTKKQIMQFCSLEKWKYAYSGNSRTLFITCGNNIDAETQIVQHFGIESDFKIVQLALI